MRLNLKRKPPESKHLQTFPIFRFFHYWTLFLFPPTFDFLGHRTRWGAVLHASSVAPNPPPAASRNGGSPRWAARFASFYFWGWGVAVGQNLLGTYLLGWPKPYFFVGLLRPTRMFRSIWSHPLQSACLVFSWQLWSRKGHGNTHPSGI